MLLYSPTHLLRSFQHYLDLGPKLRHVHVVCGRKVEGAGFVETLMEDPFKCEIHAANA